jgi:hypothetical protein
MKIATRTLAITMYVSVLVFCGCSGGSEEQGRIRVKPVQVIGMYKLKLDAGLDKLELKADGTYTQDISSKSKSFHRGGNWHIENKFLDGTEVVLTNAAVVAEDSKPRFADLPLHVHDRSGKVALARNEVADWYYEPVR